MKKENEDISAAIKALNRGNVSLAETICKNIIDESPQNADCFHLIGIIKNIQGQYEKAIGYFSQANMLQPDNPDILYNLGCTQLQVGELLDAESSLETVVKIRPSDTQAYSTLGNVLKRLGKFSEAIERHKRAVELSPSSAESVSNLASTYLAWGKTLLAIEEYRNAIALKPDSPDLHYNLGTALQREESYEDACGSFRSSLKINPDHANSQMNLGTSLKSLGQMDEALKHLQIAVELNPDSADAHWNLALALLISGDYINGWKEYEWRLKIPEMKIRKFPKPLWDGSVQTDKTLLLHAEQGMGDVIQFIRYAEAAKSKVGQIILYCHPPLKRLLSRLNGIDLVVSSERDLPEFDIHLPLLSLPGRLGCSPDNIPSSSSYINADPGLIKKWRNKLDSGMFNIGLVWAGNPRHLDDHNRSCSLSDLENLFKIKGTTFISLQKDAPTEDRSLVDAKNNFIDAAPELTDFDETAALISNLDLVISVDTAAAHLAGAIGRPAWTLLPFAPDWRWLLNRSDTPWYKSMKLFRQSSPGNWDNVILNLDKALVEIVANSKKPC